MRMNIAVNREPSYREGYRPERSKLFPGKWCVVHVQPRAGDMAETTIAKDDLTEQAAELFIRQLYDVTEPRPKCKGSRAKPGGNKPRKGSQMKLLGKGKR